MTDDYMEVRHRDPENLVDPPKEKWAKQPEGAQREVLKHYAWEADLKMEDFALAEYLEAKKGRDKARKKKAAKKQKRKKRKEKAKGEWQKLKRLARGKDVELEDEDAEEQPSSRNERESIVQAEDEEVQAEGDGTPSDANADDSARQDDPDPERLPLVVEGDEVLPADWQKGSSPSQSSQPVTQDYLNLKNDELLAEMKARNVVLVKGVKKVKTSYATALRDADTQGNRGNGVQGATKGKGKGSKKAAGRKADNGIGRNVNSKSAGKN